MPLLYALLCFKMVYVCAAFVYCSHMFKVDIVKTNKRKPVKKTPTTKKTCRLWFGCDSGNS